MLQSSEQIRCQLDGIAVLIAEHKPHLVAFQEADEASWWSGNFSHVGYVAGSDQEYQHVHACNVDGLGLHYGTALISRMPLSDARQHTFPINYPTFSKGFVLACCHWPDSDFIFDAVSLHLDFASQAVRQRQLDALANILQQRARPLLIMGDFNSEMDGGLLKPFMQKLELQTWIPDDPSLVTFPALGTRIDWIMVSRHFEIRQQRTLQDEVSDHLVVVADIRRSE
jgi:endonuclease/exonuclease/phosphatase family metal-dependent hydrolase